MASSVGGGVIENENWKPPKEAIRSPRSQPVWAVKWLPLLHPSKKTPGVSPLPLPPEELQEHVTTRKEGRKQKVSVLEYVSHSSGVLIPWRGYMNMQMLRQSASSPPSSQIPDSQALPIRQEKDCKSSFWAPSPAQEALTSESPQITPYWISQSTNPLYL